MSWAVIAILAVGTYAMRLTGPLLRSRIRISETLNRYLALGAVALLAALIVTSAAMEDRGFAGPARPAGVLVGAVLAWRRMPFVVVVLAAAGTTALLRLVFGIS
jgi:branched-subunit amino acid transport protein